MSKELKKYKARIFGELYFIVSDENDRLVLDVVDKVDCLMKEIAAKNGAIVDARKIAVLAALKSTLELMELQQYLQQEQVQANKILQLVRDEEFYL